MVKTVRPRMKIWRMHLACSISKTTGAKAHDYALHTLTHTHEIMRARARTHPLTNKNM